MTNFETYKQQLADYNASQQDFTAEFGEIDEFTEPFDDPEPESGEAREAADPVESVPA